MVRLYFDVEIYRPGRHFFSEDVKIVTVGVSMEEGGGLFYELHGL